MSSEKSVQVDHSKAYSIANNIVLKYGQETICPFTPRLPYEAGTINKTLALKEFPCKITCPKCNIVDIDDKQLGDDFPAGKYLEISCNGTIQYQPLEGVETLAESKENKSSGLKKA